MGVARETIVATTSIGTCGNCGSDDDGYSGGGYGMTHWIFP
jgi:hypothetical protein